MGLHSYCIVPRGHAPAAGLRGVGDAGLRLVESAGLGAWVSLHERPPAATPDDLRAHNAVVAAAMSTAVTPVPIRFGQWCSHEAELVRRIEADRQRWADLLARFAGRAEFGAALVVATAEAARDVRPEPGSTGTAYMQQLARRHADAAAGRRLVEQIAEEIALRLSGIQLETRLETPTGGAVAARIAHLVAWPDVDAYDQAMTEFRDSRADVHISLSGPWPPWSFTA